MNIERRIHTHGPTHVRGAGWVPGAPACRCWVSLQAGAHRQSRTPAHARHTTACRPAAAPCTTSSRRGRLAIHRPTQEDDSHTHRHTHTDTHTDRAGAIAAGSCRSITTLATAGRTCATPASSHPSTAQGHGISDATSSHAHACAHRVPSKSTVRVGMDRVGGWHRACTYTLRSTSLTRRLWIAICLGRGDRNQRFVTLCAPCAGTGVLSSMRLTSASRLASAGCGRTSTYTCTWPCGGTVTARTN
jgi:hypothetical protein